MASGEEIPRSDGAVRKPGRFSRCGPFDISAQVWYSFRLEEDPIQTISLFRTQGTRRMCTSKTVVMPQRGERD